jgi:hypothetical protein
MPFGAVPASFTIPEGYHSPDSHQAKLVRAPEPLDHPSCLFELKMDGHLTH